MSKWTHTQLNESTNEQIHTWTNKTTQTNKRIHRLIQITISHTNQQTKTQVNQYATKHNKQMEEQTHQRIDK